MRLPVSLAVIVLLWSPATAQETASPESQRAANELTAILSKDMIAQTNRAVTARLWQKLEKELEARVDKATLSELRTVFENSLTKFAEAATKDVSSLYVRYFNAEELQAMVAFYRTPAGMKALQVMPKIVTEYMTSTATARLQDFERELQVSTDNVLRKRGYKK
jgi:hypothetical protein